MVDTSLLYKTEATPVMTWSNIDTDSIGGTQKQLQLFLPFCNHLKKMAIGSIRHMAYELIPGTSWPAQFEWVFYPAGPE